MHFIKSEFKNKAYCQVAVERIQKETNAREVNAHGNAKAY
jgi:hypothetical protein